MEICPLQLSRSIPISDVLSLYVMSMKKLIKEEEKKLEFKLTSQETYSPLVISGMQDDAGKLNNVYKNKKIQTRNCISNLQLQMMLKEYLCTFFSININLYECIFMYG